MTTDNRQARHCTGSWVCGVRDVHRADPPLLCGGPEQAAAATLPDGHDKAHALLHAIGEHREEFVFENQCTGPNCQATPDDIIARLENYSGLAQAFAIADLDSVIKWHTRYARQYGIHASQLSPEWRISGLDGQQR